MKTRKLLGFVIFVICMFNMQQAESADLNKVRSSFLQTIKSTIDEFQAKSLREKENPKIIQTEVGIYRKLREFEKNYPELKQHTPFYIAHYTSYSEQYAYDIQATNSIISPYIGIVKLRSEVWDKEGDTKEEFLKAPWKKAGTIYETLKYLYQDGEWVFMGSIDKKWFPEK